MLGRWGIARSLAALLLPLEHPAARRAIARVGLEARLHDRVGLLSGGEQQRVALARLLVQDPSILLADEPISSLDPALSDDLLGLVTGMAGHGGRSVVVSLHEPAFALRHFERIVAMRGGRIAFDRPADAVTREALDDVYLMGAPEERGTAGPRRDVEPCA
jgi:phosphonate transport system ATP-binding protein